MLYPPRWIQRSAEDRTMRYVFGGFVRTTSAVPNPDADCPSVPLDDLCAWLEKRGFTADFREPSAAVYGNGRVPTLYGVYHDVEVIAHAEAGEVSSVRCRFALAADAPARLGR